ncbi:amidohydrolase family protein [Pyrinomonas methylaliphatogenes]|jgi:imidazolonepropionase-like amidohydrolase|uniref:Amidohydrolase, imidazolonepropionase n=1 Tax=Pyrinomonas methylaliphatogenes TaxID=454194 RepID=A0A0B6WZD4_9BACT|nr:amidohydrolase family protein [Pyrinomonas methylaliphatogenes]MBX5478267.1 amidohydrolase family protein [Pyrinomonas methylaliphatogenes]CDM66603.1 amidohydrolase, imidazolonepropionase [Pyrinomonas methylaliphatogenes]
MIMKKLAANPIKLSVIVLAFAAAIGAQQLNRVVVERVKTGPQGLYAIKNARIVTVAGPVIERGTVVIRDGKIEAVGANVSIPAGAQEIDASGLTVYPGMIDAGTSLGLVEVPTGAPGTVDLSEIGDMNPNAQAIIAINPHSAHVGVTRFNGVTTVATLPRGGIIAGQAAIINLDGTTQWEMALVPAAALVIDFPRVGGGGRAEFAFMQAQQRQPDLTEAIRARDQQVERLRKLLRDAEAYARAQEAYARDNRNVPRPDRNVVLEALVPYVRGERPVIFRADREQEIRAVIRFAEEMKLKPIILGGNDAWKVASLLHEKNIPVILDGVLDLPMREDDPYDLLFENAAKLQKAGVRFCISTGDTGAHVRDLPYHAGMAAAFGLPKDEALKAVTLYPAQILGIADRVGSIEPGKIANLVVADGDLLEPRTNIRYLFINGKQIPLVSRHTELYDQFKDRP